jgi:putative hydrolase of the HAD superfamily
MENDERQDLIRRIRALSSPLSPRPTNAEPVLGPLSGIRAVLFDIYGTLVVSASGDIGLAGEQDEESAFRAALAAAGLERPVGVGPHDLKADIRAFHAERRAAGVEYPEVDILTIWKSVLGSGENPERLAVEYECRVNPVWPMPGLAELLSAIRGRGLVLGIVSNAQFYTPLMLEAFLGAPLPELGFDPECCAFSYRLLEAKPSTRIYREALEGLERGHGISSGEVLYVGNDVRNDIRPAAEVGCRTALFAGDARSLRLRKDDPTCTGVRPDRVIIELGQIVSHLLPGSEREA